MKKGIVLRQIKSYLGSHPYGSAAAFLGKTFIFYFVLDYFFLAYTGLTVPGGRFYHPFFLEYADFIGAFRRFLLWGGAQLASLIGYPSGYSDYTMFIHGQSGVRMVYSCMGFGLMSAYAALILAWPAPWRNRIISLSAGLVCIILLNMIRIGGLAVLYSNGQHGLFSFINHHDVFNIVVIVIVFFFFVIHIQRATRQAEFQQKSSNSD